MLRKLVNNTKKPVRSILPQTLKGLYSDDLHFERLALKYCFASSDKKGKKTSLKMRVSVVRRRKMCYTLK